MNPCPTQPSPITPSRRFPATAGLRLNCSLADGHVQFIKNSINLGVWQALGTVAGGEIIGADSF